jgi:hypothetical protein
MAAFSQNLLRPFRALHIFHPNPRAYTLGFAVSPFQGLMDSIVNPFRPFRACLDLIPRRLIQCRHDCDERKVYKLQGPISISVRACAFTTFGRLWRTILTGLYLLFWEQLP